MVRGTTLLASGRFCLCQPLSCPHIIFPPRTVQHCHSAPQPQSTAKPPYNLLGGSKYWDHLGDLELDRLGRIPTGFLISWVWPWWESPIFSAFIPSSVGKGIMIPTLQEYSKDWSKRANAYMKCFAQCLARSKYSANGSFPYFSFAHFMSRQTFAYMIWGLARLPISKIL